MINSMSTILVLMCHCFACSPDDEDAELVPPGPPPGPPPDSIVGLIPPGND